MRSSSVVHAFLAMAGATRAQNLNQFFPVAPSFSLDSTAEFAWYHYQSTDVLKLYVQGTKGGKDTKETIALPRKTRRLLICTRRLQLTVEKCALSNVAAQECVQYVNNGSATFGGSYAAGLTPGNLYYFALQWLANDASGTNGTSKSGVFPLYSDEFLSSSSFTASAAQPPTSASTFASTSTRTIQVQTITSGASSIWIPTPTTLFTVVSTSAPSASTTAEPTPSYPPSFYGPSISKGAAAGIGIGINLGVFIIITVAALYCHRKIQRASGEKEKDRASTSENDTPMAQSDDDKKNGGHFQSELAADGPKDRPQSKGEMAAEESEAVEEYCHGALAAGKENLPPNVGQSTGSSVGIGSAIAPGELAGDAPMAVPRNPASRTHFEHTVRALVTDGELSTRNGSNSQAPHSGLGYAVANGELHADPLRSNAVYELDSIPYKPYSPSRITASHYGPTPPPTGKSSALRD